MKNRKDAFLIKETDSMHALFGYLFPDRTDNEALMNEKIDLTAIEQFIAEKNADGREFKYTFFHVLCAIIGRIVAERPHLNRFYAGSRLYERKEIILSFTVKKRFSDDAGEALARVKIDKDSGISPLAQVYSQVEKIVYSIRKENKTDDTTKIMDIIVSMPRFVVKGIVRTLKWLDYHGMYPTFLQEVDPYFSSVFISNLGSIKMHASYHHLANWGTNSFFAIIGEKRPEPVFKQDGTFELKNMLELGLTIDERIADGYYFANSIKMLRKLVANPHLLDLPMNEKIDYDNL